MTYWKFNPFAFEDSRQVLLTTETTLTGGVWVSLNERGPGFVVRGGSWADDPSDRSKKVYHLESEESFESCLDAVVFVLSALEIYIPADVVSSLR